MDRNDEGVVWLATTRHTRRTNEWLAVAEAVRVETSETESQITRAKKGDRGARGSKEEKERKLTGKGKGANRADCYKRGELQEGENVLES